MTNTQNYHFQDILHVTQADLRANRAGYITHGHMQKLTSAKYSRIQTYTRDIIVYSVLIIALIILTTNQMLFIKFLIALPIMSLLVLLSIEIHNLKWEIQNQPIFSGEIISQTGIIKAYDRVSSLGTLSSIQINTDGEIFRLSSGIVSMLNIGEVYTVYYLADTKTIVAIEKADQASTLQAIEEELDYLEAVQASLKTDYLR